ncbi:hypothetical protein TIFTF001_024768 [Ficus carica]|uniref:Uncharacterized protein n=1 Tax=Ficus carica TaxID=3494 RepID=A0AA88ALW1_FICCA|nr:hypothetical protein TIFTF001_024768 [Ficus carica]
MKKMMERRVTGAVVFSKKGKHNDVNVHDYDVILTTHELVQYASANCPESFLEKVQWWRLILDDVRCDKWPECHDALAEFPSILLLVAKRKWVVARKPIFVDFMKAVCLQRKRGQVVREFTTDVLVPYAHELTPNERAKYEIEANLARVNFRKAVDKGDITDVVRVYINVSLMSMICGRLAPYYPQYTGDRFRPTLEFFPSASEAAAVNAITKCGHHFYIECIEKVVTRLQICPNCREPLKVCDVYLPHGSSKLSALLRLLEASREAQAATKSIVYTEFDTMIKFMEANIRCAGFHVFCLSLEDNGQPVLDFDDESVIAEFKERGEKEHVVLLATRKQRLAGISRDCTIYFLEPWGFDMPKVDAVDLLYRACQENRNIVMFFSKETVQERMMYHGVIQPIVFQDLQRTLSTFPLTLDSSIAYYSRHLGFKILFYCEAICLLGEGAVTEKMVGGRNTRHAETHVERGREEGKVETHDSDMPGGDPPVQQLSSSCHQDLPTAFEFVEREREEVESREKGGGSQVCRER